MDAMEVFEKLLDFMAKQNEQTKLIIARFERIEKYIRDLEAKK